MGKGGDSSIGTTTSTTVGSEGNAASKQPTKTTTNYNNWKYCSQKNQSSSEWVSPFSPETVDPQVARDKHVQVKDFPTKSQLRAVIPPHCFERSVVRSLAYVLRDILQGVVVWYVTYHVLGLRTDPPTTGLFSWKYVAWRCAWSVYGIVMGFAVGGLWVLGHECGHGAFSSYPIVNGAVGWILHSAMLVPYFSWAFSHAKHHRRTNDLVDGETHTPPVHTDMGLTQDKQRVSNDAVRQTIYGSKSIAQAFAHNLYGHARLHDAIGDDGFALFMMWSRLLFGWQFYLTGVKSTGHNGADGKPIAKDVFPDHFRPRSRLFPSKMYAKVIASDIGILLMVGLLSYCSWVYSFRAVWMWYFGPYMLINAFLVTVTWLQHTDPTVPQFDTEHWSWIKGAIAGTIDRPTHAWVNYCSHNICTTHVVHHLFHEIPHYHAVEATAAVRAYLEPQGLYNYDPTPILKALWRVCKKCHYVESLDSGIQYYQSLEDIPRSHPDDTKKQPATRKEMKKDQ